MRSNTFGLMFFFNAPDKSISHRALFFAALSKQKGQILNLSTCEDVLSTLKCLTRLGFTSDFKGEILYYNSTNFPYHNKSVSLNCGNSGTTARLILGLLTGLDIEAKLIGDKSLSNRPMLRVITPLENMGANISHTDGKLPAMIKKSNFSNTDINITNSTPSAQVKSAIILHALASNRNCILYDNHGSRDHTELMALSSGCKLDIQSHQIIIPKSQASLPSEYHIYNDPSSAFFIVAAAILLQKKLILKNLYLNPTRIMAYEVLKRMSANISYQNVRTKFNEKVGDIEVIPSQLNSIDIAKEDIPKLIDEVPMLAIICCFADGESKINGLEELRYKESDRLELIYKNLKKLGALIQLNNNCLTISKSKLTGKEVIETCGDHRIVMAFEILNLVLNKKNIINDQKCVKISFPNFYEELSNFASDTTL